MLGIPPAPRGIPQIEVSFDIDANGIVNVSAKDKATNKEQQIRIQASGGLSEDEIAQMVKDAELHASADRQRRELIDARNKADSLIYSTERSLNEAGENVTAEVKDPIQNAINTLRETMKNDNIEDIQNKTNTLSQLAMKLGESLYKDQGNASDKVTSSGDPDILDADFQDVSDNPKNKS